MMPTPIARGIPSCIMMSVLVIVIGGAANASPRNVVWAPQSVRFPVNPETIDPKPGSVPPDSGETTAPVKVTEQQAAVVWIGPAEIVRVRAVRGDLSTLRARRVVGTRGARLWIDEPGVSVDAGMELIEPVGPGSTWVLTATKPLTIVVETTRWRAPRLVWEVARADLATWIERDGAMPAVPGDEERAVELRLLGARAFVRALGDVPSPVKRALQLWRRLDAEDAIALRRGSIDPYIHRTDRTPTGETITDDSGQRFGPVAGPWTHTVDGPGTVFVETCAERPATGWGDDMGAVEVRLDGALAALSTEVVSPPVMAMRNAALATDRDGQRFGRRIRAEVAIGPGRHVIEVTTKNTRWVRLEERARRRRLRDPDFLEQLLAERVRLAATAGPHARAAERLLAGAPAPSLLAAPAGLPPAAAAYLALRTAPALLTNEQATEQLAVVNKLIEDPQLEQSVREALVYELATRLPLTVGADSVAAIVIGWKRVAPALLGTLAVRLQLGLPANAVGAAEQAWREAPNGVITRAAMLATARLTPFQRVVPRIANGNLEPRHLRWLSPVTALDEDAVGALFELPIGKPWSFEIPPAPGAADRLALVRVLALTDQERPGPIKIWLDDHAYQTIGMAAVDRFELAAKPGKHTLRVDAPAASRLFVTVPGARGDKRGIVKVFHANAPGPDTPRYILPSSRNTGPVRVELRTRFTDAAEPRRFEAWLHSDAGPPRRLVFEVSETDKEMWPIGGEAKLSTGATSWIWVPPQTGRVWITTDTPELIVSMSIRRGRAEALPSEAEEPPLPDPLAEVARQSEIIAKSPSNTAAHLARARALIELGEPIAAKRDLAAAGLTAVGREIHELATRLADLEARVDQSYLPAQPPSSPVVDGSAITPLLPIELDLTESVELVRKTRTNTVISAPPSVQNANPSLPMRWAMARMATLANRHHDAVLLWSGVDTWQARVATLVHLTAAPFEDPDRDAATAYGLAERLGNVEVPRIRRARAIATRSSRWSPITSTSTNAGIVQLKLPVTQSEPSPRALVRAAMLAAPWPEAKLLDPGRELTFDVMGPATVRVEAWCRRLYDQPANAVCKPSVRIDQQAPLSVAAPLAQRVKLIETNVEAGRHRVTVELANDDPEMLAAINLEESGNAGPPPARKSTVFLAEPAHPAEIVISGPSTLSIELRSFGMSMADAQLAKHANVRVQGSRDERTQVALDPELVTIESAVVSTSVKHVVVVPEGTHRIAIAPWQGRLAVRFWRRVAAGDDHRDPPTRVLLPSILSTGLPWRSSLQVPLRAGAEHSPRSVPSIEVVIGQDTADTLDGEGRVNEVRFELATQLRRRTRRSTWMGELRGRQVGTRRPTGRARLVGDFDQLPGGLGAHLDLGGGVVTSAEATAWRFDGGARLDRGWRLNQWLVFAPDIGVRGGLLGPDPVPSDLDPWIAGIYRRQHPIQWVARTSLRARPFADQLGIVRVEARSNSDLTSLDLVGATLAWRGLMELSPLRGPVWSFAYHPSYRFADQDRSIGYVRHDVGLELIWGFAVRRGRFAVSVWAQAYPASANIKRQSSFGLSLRWDDVRPGESVLFGYEEPLADFVDEVSWRSDR